MKSCKVVVIGGLHHNTLGVIRSLGENQLLTIDMDVLIVGENLPAKNMISVSRYVKKVHYVCSDADIVRWLLELSRDANIRTIICCSDGSAEVVMQNKVLLEKYYKIPSVKLNIEALMEKSTQDIIAEKCGLHTPDSQVYTSTEDINWEVFPCIIKPLKSATGAGKSDIHISNDKKTLQKAMLDIKAPKVQIQQYIIKKMEFQLIGCSLDAGEIIIIPGYTDLIRQPKNTNTGYLEYVPISELNVDMLAVQEFIKTIGYSGLFSVEFIRGVDGNDYFLEINMRNDGNAYCVQSAGVNLPLIWCYYQNFGELPNVPLSFSKSIKFIPDLNDLKVSLGQVGIITWIRDFLGADSHSVYNKRDLMPFVYELMRPLKNILHI